MALHRSKLGQVGGGGKGDGGVVVDLDPLSAFALMGQSTEGASAPRGTEPGSSVHVGSGRRSNNSSSGTHGARNVDQQRAELPPPLSVQPTAGMGGWHSVELNVPASASRVLFAYIVSTAFSQVAVGIRSYGYQNITRVIIQRIIQTIVIFMHSSSSRKYCCTLFYNSSSKYN